MYEVSSEYRWRLPDDAPEEGKWSALDEILCEWLFVAALAWEGYQQEGRGTVVVDEDGRVHYRRGSICTCHEELVAEYDPEQRAVVALVGPGGIRAVHAASGWPAPPDAALVTPAERRTLTAH